MDKDRFAILISRISMLTRDKNDLENEVNKKRFEHTTYAIKPEHLAHWAMAAVGDIGLKVQYKLAHVRYTPAAPRVRRPTNHGAATCACIMHDPARGTNCIYATRLSSIATVSRPESRNARNKFRALYSFRAYVFRKTWF